MPIIESMKIYADGMRFASTIVGGLMSELLKRPIAKTAGNAISYSFKDEKKETKNHADG